MLYYQPQISLATGAVTGAEAFLHWNHPELGMVPPGRFISIMAVKVPRRETFD